MTTTTVDDPPALAEALKELSRIAYARAVCADTQRLLDAVDAAKAAGLTTTECAERLGMSRAAIYKARKSSG